MNFEVKTFLFGVFATVAVCVAEAALSPSGDLSGASDYAAITAAVAEGGVVELAEGTFYVNSQIQLESEVMLKGAGRDLTVISYKGPKANAGRVIRLNSALAALESVTVSDGYGYAVNGAGILIDTDGGVVRDCRVTNCLSTMNSNGALAVCGVNGVVTRTIIDNNSNDNAYGNCPGVYMTAGEMNNCLITGNRVINCASRNYAVSGGLFLFGSVTVRNCTIAGNHGRGIGGVSFYNGFNWSSGGQLVNCIIADNTATDNFVPAHGCKDWNSNNTTVSRFEACMFSASATVPNDTCFNGGAGFKGNGNFHLASNSPSRGKAAYVYWMESMTDLDGVAFLAGGAVDLGCYQYVASSTFTCEIEASATTVFKDDTVTLSAVLESGVDPSGYSFYWTIGDLPGIVGQNPEVTFTATGVYDVTLTVTNNASSAEVFSETKEAFLSVYERTVTLSVDDDVAAAFAQAVDGQEFVFADEDEYVLNSEIIVTAAVRIRGQGIDKTVVSMRSGAKKRLFTLNNAAAVLSGMTLKNGGGFDTNASLGNGGGVLIEASGGTIEDCRITGCGCGMNDSGAAVYIDSAKGRVTRCIIDNNENRSPWPSGGAITMKNGIVDNCLICSNKVSNGTQRKYYVTGGITLSGGVISNCTVAANSGRGLGGVSCSPSSGEHVVNCVLYGNTAATSVGLDTHPDLTDWNGSDGCVVTSLISPEVSPFRDFAGGDYRLGAGTPAQGTGSYTAAMDEQVDLLGNPRARDGAVDMGCYENLGYEDWIVITGLPDCYGTVSPAYGLHDGIESGDAFDCEVTALPSGDNAPVLLGWKLEDAEGTEVASGTGSSFTYTHNGEYRKLVWQWGTLFTVTATSGGGGSVNPSSVSVGFGEKVTLTATPDPEVPGAAFWKWTGDVPAGREYANPLELTVDKSKNLTAVFGAAVTYVAPSTATNETPSAPYSMVETAANSIADALSVTVDGGTVMLLDGEHEISEAVLLDRAVTVRGMNGAGRTTVRQIARTGDVRRVFVLNHSRAEVIGLTITGGYAYNVHGGAVYIDNAGGSLYDCVLTGNETSMNSSGTLCMNGAASRVSRCVISNNINKNNYGNCPGVSISAGVMDNCLIAGNAVTWCSGRKYAVPAGVSMSGGIISNCTITANSGRGVGGLSFYDGFNWKGGTVVNSIIFGNSATEDYAPETAPEYYSNNASHFVNTLFAGIVFKDAENGNYRQDRTSAGISAGVYSETMDDEFDLAGGPRVKYIKVRGGIKEGFVDVGCYESVYSELKTLIILK